MKTANEYFQKLTEVAVGDERPEVLVARQKVSQISGLHQQPPK